MVSVLASSAVDLGFGPRSNQRLLNWYLLLLHAALRRESKDWLARNQNNMSEWNDMSTHGLLFQ
jgi:predicted LPLAT superfamily acyltransferase